MKTILIQIQPGSDTSTFDIYTDTDSYTTPIHYNVTKQELIDGYISTIVPDNSSIIKVSSNSIICPDQYILIPITTTTTTTTTTNSDNIVYIYPSFDGTWSRTTPEVFSLCRNNPSATTTYYNTQYNSGTILSTTNSNPTISSISRYYSKFNIEDIINNGITQYNITSISLRVYLTTPGPLVTPITLDLYESGDYLTPSVSRYGSYILNNRLITTPNIIISNIIMDSNGYYTFEFNTYGLYVVNQRLNNNQDIVLGIVTNFDSNSINPPNNPPVTITFKSILEPNPIKYPKLIFTTT